ncbi:MAG: hypothetical protein B6U69_02575 [Thermofilum sp. ex4484_15]|nr:MAG: hypothetical protein B6U69_02575 [Thermofilum sp. ex4484_15]
MPFRDEVMALLNYVGKGEVIAGSERDREVAEKLRGFFESIGLETKLIPITCMSWSPRVSFVEIGNRELRAEALPYTPSGDVEGKLVFAGWGLYEREWRGVKAEDNIVLLEWFKDSLDDINWQYMNAVAKGAKAVIFFDPYPNRLRRIVITFERNYKWGPGAPPPIPALVIERSEGLRLVRRARRGVKVRVFSEVKLNHKATTHIVEAGRREGILLTAHYDRWFNGFTDNRLGVALVLALAKEFSDGVNYVIFGGEESGAPGYSPWYWIWGSRNYVSILKERGELDEILAVVNIDVVGSSPIRINASGPDLIEGVKEVLNYNQTISYDLDSAIFDSFSFSKEGVPALTVNSLDQLLEIYHTDIDSEEIIIWTKVKEAYEVTRSILRSLIRKGSSILRYEAFRKYVEGELSYLKDKYQEAAKVIELIRGMSLDEEKARRLRRKLISVTYEGRYEETFLPFSTTFLPQLLIKEDLKKVEKAEALLKQGKLDKAIEVLRSIPDYRVIPGEERILPYVNLRGALSNAKAVCLEHLLSEAKKAIEEAIKCSLVQLEDLIKMKGDEVAWRR